MSTKIRLEDISEFADVSRRVRGDRVKIKEIIDVPIVIWKANICPSSYRDIDGDPNKVFVRIEFSTQSNLNKRYSTSTSSYYLIEDISEIDEKDYPFKAVITTVQLKKLNADGTPKFAYVLK